MTNRIAILALTTALTFAPSAQAQAPRTPPPSSPSPARAPGPKTPNELLGRLEVIWPTDSTVRSVYGEPVGFDAELRVPVARQVDVSGGFGYMSKTGQLTVTHEETKLTTFPIEGTVLVRVAPGRISPYVGAGATALHYSESNPIGSVSKWALGFLAAGGFTMQATPRFVIDARLKYSYVKTKTEETDVNLGGISLAAGAGIRF